LYHPSGFTVGSLEEDLQRGGFSVKEHTIGTNFRLVCTKGERKFVIDMLAGRQSYVQAIQDRAVGHSIATAALPVELDTPQVDLLVLCGINTVGDFPPLALRACEIYFADVPLTSLQLDLILDRFARTEQRLGV
jgi:hypothetical protein